MPERHIALCALPFDPALHDERDPSLADGDPEPAQLRIEPPSAPLDPLVVGELEAF